MNRHLILCALALLTACGSSSSALEPMGPDAEAEADAAACDAPPVHSVAWLLTQPYAACADGARASDNIMTLLVEHPVTGQCTYPCAADAALCADLGAECDELGYCVP